MAKILINNTPNNIELDVGLTVPGNGQLTIDQLDFADAAGSDDIVTQVGNGNLTVNDGSSNLTISDGIDLIKGLFPNSLTLVGPTGPTGEAGAAGVSGFGVYAFSNTQSDATILKARGLTISKVGTGLYDYTFTTPTPDTNYIVSVSFFNLGTNTDTNGFIDNKTVNGFRVQTGIGDNGTAVDTVADTNHSVIVLGDAGPQGITSSYEAWLSIGNTGTEADFLATLVGPQGATGPQGPQGPAGDSQIRVSPNDSTVGFIEDKFVAENNKISVQVLNDGGDEDIQIGVNPGNIGTSELNNDANFIDASGAPVQPGDIANFETSSQLNTRDVNNRNRANHTGTQLASTISDFGAAVQSSETDTALSFNNTTKILSYTNESGTTTNVDLTQFLDDTNLARITSGSLDGVTGIATFTRDDTSTFTVDFSSLNDQAAINAAISSHETSLSNHDDINTAGVVNGDFLRRESGVWVPYNDYKASASLANPVCTQLTSFQQALRLDYDIPEAGNYELSVSYIWSYNATNNDFIARVQINDTDIFVEHEQEPRDSAGTGIIVDAIEGGSFNTGTDQRLPFSYSEVITLPAGVGFVDLDIRNQQSNLSATVYKASITLKRFN